MLNTQYNKMINTNNAIKYSINIDVDTLMHYNCINYIKYILDSDMSRYISQSDIAYLKSMIDRLS